MLETVSKNEPERKNSLLTMINMAMVVPRICFHLRQHHALKGVAIIRHLSIQVTIDRRRMTRPSKCKLLFLNSYPNPSLGTSSEHNVPLDKVPYKAILPYGILMRWAYGLRGPSFGHACL